MLEGLEGAAAVGGSGRRFDRGRMEQILAGLGKRVFLMHNVHEDAPAMFETRWAMSYLGGPLTRVQIGALTEARKEAAGEPAAAGAAPTPAAASAPSAPAAAPGSPPSSAAAAARPVLPPGIEQGFLPLRGRPEGGTVYRPHLLGLARVRYVDAAKKVDRTDELALLAPVPERAGDADWYDARALEPAAAELESEPADGNVAFAPLPAPGGDPKSYAPWAKGLSDALYRTRTLDLFACPALDQLSTPGEVERAFRIRLAEAAREARDRATEELRRKYGSKVAALEERQRRAEQRVEREREQAHHQQLQTAVSFGATLLGAFLGRKRVSVGTLGRATTAARGVGRSVKESQDVARAQEDVAAVRRAVADLQTELQTEVDATSARYDPTALVLERVAVKPRRADVEVRKVALAWAPYRPGAGGPEPAWE